jgi:hypothetical protein
MTNQNAIMPNDARKAAEMAAREWWNSAEVYGGPDYRIFSLAKLLMSFASEHGAPITCGTGPAPITAADVIAWLEARPLRAWSSTHGSLRDILAMMEQERAQDER